MIHWWYIYNAFMNRLQERKINVDSNYQVMRHLIGWVMRHSIKLA